MASVDTPEDLYNIAVQLSANIVTAYNKAVEGGCENILRAYRPVEDLRILAVAVVNDKETGLLTLEKAVELYRETIIASDSIMQVLLSCPITGCIDKKEANDSLHQHYLLREVNVADLARFQVAVNSPDDTSRLS